VYRNYEKSILHNRKFLLLLEEEQRRQQEVQLWVWAPELPLPVLLVEVERMLPIWQVVWLLRLAGERMIWEVMMRLAMIVIGIRFSICSPFPVSRFHLQIT
jgi:hypothetical protein